jgi:predicted permease
VRAAALVRAMPFDQNTETLAAAFDGQPLDDAAHALQVDANVVSDGYFATMGLPVRRGRDFSERDDERTPMVAVVSEELARRAWPDGSPIGKRLRTEAWPDWATVIGVVPDAKQLQLSESPRPQVYVSFRQRPMIFTSVVLRTADDPMRHAEAARRAVWRVDADQAVWRMHDVARSIASSTGAARALATLTTVFALVALTLAAVGIFGVMSFVVAQRRREMGIRIALGAKGGQIAAMVVRHGLRLTAVALALGLAGALSSGRLLASQLYGVAPHDPVALGAVAALLAAVALVACWLPARRASRVDPKMSLQAE